MGELGSACIILVSLSLAFTRCIFYFDQSANHKWERRHPSLLNRSTKVKLEPEVAF